MESGAHQEASPRVLQQRARFDALRTRVFEEMGRGAARWRLTWILPFNGFVVLLVARGESHDRAWLQGAAVALIGVLFIARMFWNHTVLKATSFLLGVGSYFVLLATTGGLASPLLMTGGMMMAAAAITVVEPRWMRGAVFVLFLVGFVGLALLSRTSALAATLPLASGLATPEYVSLALLASVFGMMGVYRIGCTMTRGYERAAMELAERREELCTGTARARSRGWRPGSRTR
jgi:hypothetical protein